VIFETMAIMKEALQQYLLETEGFSAAGVVVLDNIAMAQDLGGTRDNLNQKIVVSLVNPQEEATLKNEPFQRLENGRTVYRNPPTQLNIYVLFSVLDSVYETALKRLSRIIEFFQWKKIITFTTAQSPSSILQEVQIFPDLCSLTFEQLNYLWGSLGGKQVPFALYRVRMVAIEAEKRLAESEPITKILINTDGEIK
jgi:hypothetical protein